MRFSKKYFLVVFPTLLIVFGLTFILLSKNKVEEKGSGLYDEVEEGDVVGTKDEEKEPFDPPSVSQGSSNPGDTIEQGNDSVADEYPEELPEYEAGHIILKYQGNLSEEELLSQLKRATGLGDVKIEQLSGDIFLVASEELGQISSEYFSTHGVTGDKENDIDPEFKVVLGKVSTIPGVTYSEPDFKVSIGYTPNDAYYDSDQWALNNTEQTGGTEDADIDAPEAWDIEMGDSEVVVAVIDTGVDLDHPDLDDQILKDGDGNVIGHDFVNGDSDPSDDHGHGTHCAGIVAAEFNNDIGIAGVCPNCKIMSIKFLSSEGNGSDADAIASIQYAIDHGADIISNSWGGYGYSQALQDVINKAYNHGIVIIASAGNSGGSQPSYPAAMDHVISVAATDHDDNRTFFSSFGPTIDVSAPGLNVLSTILPEAVLSDTCRDDNHGGASDGYGKCSGTSMSAPHVAGVAGLIKSKEPMLAIDEAIEKVYMSTDDFGDTGWDEYYGFGRINALYAVGGTIPPSYVHGRILSPSEDERVGELGIITGEAIGSSFSYYTIEVGAGSSPVTWLTAGITLENGGLSKVFDGGLLGTWDTTGLASGIWTIKLSVFGYGGKTDEDLKSVLVDTDLHTGWPQKLDKPTSFTINYDPKSLVVGDIDHDGQEEIIVASRDNNLYAWNDDGTLVEGEWPVYIGGNNVFTPALADLDGNGTLEIVVGNQNGYYVLNVLYHDGTSYPGWPKPFPVTGHIVDAPTIEDLDNDGVYEIVLVTAYFNKRMLRAFRVDGSELSELPGFPIYIENLGYNFTGCSIGDLDFDNDKEIVFGIEEYIFAFHHDGTVVSGWPIFTHPDETVIVAPSIGDIDGDLENEVIATSTNFVFVIEQNGEIVSGWPKETSGVVKNAFASLGDLDNDDIAEIVLGDGEGNIYAWKGDGSYVSGWPVFYPEINPGRGNSAVIGDVDDDGYLEVIIGTYDGLKILNHDGSELWSKEVYVKNCPAIADIDSDGTFEVIAIGREQGEAKTKRTFVYVWDLEGSYDERKVEWGMIGHDPYNTNIYSLGPAFNTDLSVTLSASSDLVYSGESLTYTLEVTNNGSTAATRVGLVQRFYGLMDLISINLQQGTCLQSGGKVYCHLGTLEGGNSTFVEVVVVPAVQQESGMIRSEAVVKSFEGDMTWSNNIDGSEVQVDPSECDLGIIYIRDDKDPVYQGDFVEYDVVFRTWESDKVYEAITTITLSDHLEIDYIGGGNGGIITVEDNVVTWKLYNLAPNVIGDLSIRARAVKLGLISIEASIASNYVEEPDLTNNTLTEDTEIIDHDYSAPEMAYPADGQVLAWGADESYMFKINLPEYAVGFEYELKQRGDLIYKDYSKDPTGEFAVHPDHPCHEDFQPGFAEVEVRVKLINGKYTESCEFGIVLLDYQVGPTFIDPLNGDIVIYGQDFGIRLEEVLGADGYLIGLFQNGELIYEEFTTENELIVDDVSSPTFTKGHMWIWVRALAGGKWTKATVIYVEVKECSKPPMP